MAQQGWRSLFLPIESTESAVFADFFTPLVDRRPGAPPGSRGLTSFDLERPPSQQDAGCAILVVLASQHVRVLNLRDGSAGPKPLAADIPPQPNMRNGVGLQARATATCASLVPLPIAWACRVPDPVAAAAAAAAGGGAVVVPRPPMLRETDSSGDSAVDAPTAAAEQRWSLLRGVVGSSNGRVDVFTESGFVFGLVAHPCAVAAAEALFVGDVSGPPAASRDSASIPMGSIQNSSYGGTALRANANNNSVGGGGGFDGVGSSAASSAAAAAASKGAAYFARSGATSALGFATLGVDGHLFIWKRATDGSDAFHKDRVATPGLFTRCRAFCVSQPLQRVALSRLSHSAHVAASGLPVTPGAAAATADGASPAASPARGSSSAFSGLSPEFAAPNGIRAALPSLVIGAGVVPVRSAYSEAHGSSRSRNGGGGGGGDMDLAVLSVETLQLAESIVELPGAFKDTTAVAVDGPLTVAARERVVYAINYGTRTCSRVLTTSSDVTRLALLRPLVVAGCASGSVYVAGAESGTLLGRYETYSRQPVVGLAFNSLAMLLAIVDASGAVELAELPRDYQRHGQLPAEATLGAAAGAAAGDVLRRVVALEEGRRGAGGAAAARAAALEEQLLLARYAVPEDARAYLSPQVRLL